MNEGRKDIDTEEQSAQRDSGELSQTKLRRKRR